MSERLRTAALEGLAEVRLVESTAEIARNFETLGHNKPAIIEAHRLAGHYDYVLRFRAADMTAWTAFSATLEDPKIGVQLRPPALRACDALNDTASSSGIGQLSRGPDSARGLRDGETSALVS
jgi:DNA-binding Lrp family transcriptional regulator